MQVLLALLLGLTASAAGKVDASLVMHLGPEDRTNAIVSFGANPSDLEQASSLSSRRERGRFVVDRLKKAAAERQAAAIRFLEERRIKYRPFYVVNAISVEGATLARLEALAELPAVTEIYADGLYALRLPAQPKPLGAPEDKDIPDNIKAVGADKVWREFTRGEGIVIGGQDSGFDWKHPAIRRQYRGSFGLDANHNYSWHDAIHGKSTGSCPADGVEPCDDSGHGTHTMGTMVGTEGTRNHVGVAPEAKWIGCRNMDKGVGTASTYLECFEFFLAPFPLGGDSRADGQPDMAPHVINNSWACPPKEGCKGGEFLEAIRALHAAGILVVASVGNDGPDCGSAGDPPGNYSGELVSVAAFDHRDGKIADFSSRGPSSWNGGIGASIAAPGSMIRSAVPRSVDSSLYDYKSGTSMSGPHVAGVVALLWAARPDLLGRIPETMRQLQVSATPKTSTQNCGMFQGNKIPNAVFGYGAVDAYKAIQLTE